MKKSIWIILIFAILWPVIVVADEKQDFEQLLNYAQVVGEGSECVSDEERNAKLKLIATWIKEINPRTDDLYFDLFKDGMIFNSAKFKANPNLQTCRQALENWNNTDWPNVKVSETAESAMPETKWYCKSSSSKMEDTAEVYCANTSIDTLPNSSGTSKDGDIFIRCAGNRTEAFIVWPNFIGRRSVSVETKIDSGPIERANWSPSEDGKAVFSPQPIKWIKSLKDKKRLIVRLAPYQRTKEELEFDLTGINDVIDKVSEACKWKK